MDPAALGTLVVGVIVAVGGLLKLVFAALQHKDETFVGHLDTQEARQEKFLGNHMSAMTKTLGNVSDNMQSLHDDNLLAAAALVVSNERIEDSLRLVRADALVSNHKKAEDLLEAARKLAVQLKADDQDTTRKVEEQNNKHEPGE